jgi:hypothetical protein
MSRGDAVGAGRGGLPDPLRRFLELFNRGDYWKSHEALEDAWRELDSGFYHGLILYASAFVHARRGTRHGIRAQMEKAGEALAPYPSPYLGLDVDGIRRHAARCREIVEARPEGSDPDWEALIPFPTLESDPERIRGDEPELRAG